MRFIISYMITHFVSCRKQYVAVIVMLSLSALLIGVVQYLRVYMESRQDSCEEFLAVDSSHVLITYTDVNHRSAVPTGNIEGVTAYGAYHEDCYDVNGKSIEAVSASSGLCDFVKLSVVEGELPKQQDDGTYLLMLGYDVDAACVGDEIEWKDYFGENHRGFVCGKLSPGSRWLNVADNFDGQIGETGISLDQRILCFAPNADIIDSAFFFITEQNNVNVKQKVQSFLESNGNHVIKLGYLSDIFAVADVENKGIVRMVRESVWLVIVVTVILMACIQTVVILNFRRIIGIWYANGVSRRQAIGVFATALLLSTLFALAFVGIVLLCIYRRVDIENIKSVREVVRTRVVGRVLSAIFLMDVLGFLLPLYTLMTGKPAELLSEYRK